MTDVEDIILETNRNKLRIRCQSASAVSDMKRILKFSRMVQEQRPIPDKPWKKERVTKYEVEACYDIVEPLVLSCSAGFKELIIARAPKRYRIKGRDITPAKDKPKYEADWSLIDQSIIFRHSQKEALEAMCSNPRGMIICPTAYGKSFLISQFCKINPKAKILVSTYAKSVLLDRYRDISKTVGCRVGLHCSGHKENLDARIKCVSQGLLKHYVNMHNAEDFDIFLCEEAHEWGPKAKLLLLQQIHKARMYSFTANATRPDGAHFHINGIFGPVLASISYEDAVEHKLVTPITVVWAPSAKNNPIAKVENKIQRERYGIWRNHDRNKRIAQIARLFEDNEQVLITVKTIDHALHIKEYLPEFTVVHSAADVQTLKRYDSMGLLKGVPPMTNERLLKLKSDYENNILKKVIVTGVWSRGVNFVHLRVLIRADAANSEISDVQICGRTSRVQDNKDMSFIFDMEDTFDREFSRKAEGRSERYKELGWTQVKLSDISDMKF